MGGRGICSGRFSFAGNRVAWVPVSGVGSGVLQAGQNLLPIALEWKSTGNLLETY
jgi:hypothetical protein